MVSKEAATPETPPCPHCGMAVWRSYVQVGSYVLRCGYCHQDWCATSYCAIGPEDAGIIEAVADVKQSTDNGVAMICAELFGGDLSRAQGIKTLLIGQGVHRDLYPLISRLAAAGAFIWISWLPEAGKHDPTPNLLATFDCSIERELLFLTEVYGASHVSGASSYDAPCPTLTQKDYSKLAGSFFWWINRYQTDSVTLDICYGDREFLVKPRLFYSGHQLFHPWELLSAAGLPYDHSISGKWWVLSCANMERVIAGMAGELERHWQFLENPGHATFDRALVQRGQRMVSAREEQRKKDRERACVEASTAFHEKRYQDAISLLSPFEVDEGLSASARKLLSIARRQLG